MFSLLRSIQYYTIVNIFVSFVLPDLIFISYSYSVQSLLTWDQIVEFVNVFCQIKGIFSNYNATPR